MSRREPHARERGDGFPRVSGDEPLPSTPQNGEETFSPRERG